MAPKKKSVKGKTPSTSKAQAKLPFKKPAKKATPSKPLSTRRKSYKVTDLPISKRKTLEGQANELDRKASKLNTILKPGQQLALVKGKGKKKSQTVYPNFEAIAKALRTDSGKWLGKNAQKDYIGTIKIVKFEGVPSEYELKAAVEEGEKESKRLAKVKAYRRKDKEEIKNLRERRKELEERLAASNKRLAETERKTREAERKVREYKRLEEHNKLMNKLYVASMKEMATLRKNMAKLQAQVTKQGKK